MLRSLFWVHYLKTLEFSFVFFFVINAFGREMVEDCVFGILEVFCWDLDLALVSSWRWYKQKMNLKYQNLSHFISHFAQPIPSSEAYLPGMGVNSTRRQPWSEESATMRQVPA